MEPHPGAVWDRTLHLPLSWDPGEGNPTGTDSNIFREYFKAIINEHTNH